MFNIAVLGSTRGSNLPGLAHHLQNSAIHIHSVISNKKNAGILEKANELHLPTLYISNEQNDFEKKLDNFLLKNKTDLLVLMGFMKILSPWFIERGLKKIINVHPSLLPKHAGLMDLSVHQSVLNAKEIESGCTVHWVSEQVDSGEIILQKKCCVLPNDDARSLKKRVQSLEVSALAESIKIVSRE